jgi:hypothetical protein
LEEFDLEDFMPVAINTHPGAMLHLIATGEMLCSTGPKWLTGGCGGLCGLSCWEMNTPDA